MEDRLLYRVPDVALILNISRSKVYELFASGIRLVRSRSNCDALGGRRPFEELVMRLMIIVQGRWVSLPRGRGLL